MNYKAYFFDFDGVLADSVEVKTLAFAKLFEEFGAGIQEKVVAHHRNHGGMSRYDKFRHYYNCKNGDKRLMNLLKTFDFCPAIDILKEMNLYNNIC